MKSDNASQTVRIVLVLLLLAGGGGYLAWRSGGAKPPISAGPGGTHSDDDMMKLYQRLCEGKASAGDGHHQDALAIFEEIITAAPDSSYRWDAEIQCGFSHAALGHTDEALDRLNQVIRACPDAHLAWLARLGKADVLGSSGQYEPAARILEEIINTNKEGETRLCEEALLGLAKLHERQGQFSRLRGTLWRLIHDYPGAEDTRRRAAEARMGELDAQLTARQKTQIDAWTGKRIDHLPAGQTAWSAADGPYLVTQTVTIDPGAVLSIEAGARVRFTAGARLEVRGRLIVAGTEDRHVELTPLSDESGRDYWLGIEVAGGQGAVEMSHCRIAGADTALSLKGGKAVLRACAILRAGQTAIYAERGSSLALVGCAISDSDRCGIECQGNVTVELTDCQVSNVAAQGFVHTRAAGRSALRRTGIQRCGEEAVSARGTAELVIEQCRVLDNSGDGVAARDGMTLALSGSKVAGNAKAGVRVLDRSRARLADNEIVGNAGGGVLFEGRCAGEMSGNLVAENQTAGVVIGLDSTPAITMNRIARNRGVGVIVRNAAPAAIRNNDLSGNAEHALRNEGGNKITALENWWGSPDEAQVIQAVQDRADNAEWGEVEYRPWLSQPPVNLVKAPQTAPSEGP
ncbi:MAG: right-handed parallel beta-helix repeat-containing protein [Phycisphaerae bacterium]|jgi:tetratricopeptide (TPR) repeat protein